MRRFLASFLIFLLAWLPMAFVGLFAVAAMLLTEWDGRTTWFGNYLYGRLGNHHTPANPTFWQQWNFIAVRNPVSNFGKFTLSRDLIRQLAVVAWAGAVERDRNDD